MFQDARVGLRLLRKQPGFTALAVLTLALGIGATAAVFSLVQGALLMPPPYPQPDRLMLVLSADRVLDQRRTWRNTDRARHYAGRLTLQPK